MFSLNINGWHLNQDPLVTRSLATQAGSLLSYILLGAKISMSTRQEEFKTKALRVAKAPRLETIRAVI